MISSAVSPSTTGYRSWKGLWCFKTKHIESTTNQVNMRNALVYMTEVYSDPSLIGGMRAGDQRLWAAVLLTYLHDFENSIGHDFHQAVLDFMESIETGDLAYIAELANINFDNFLKLCIEKLNT